MLQRTLYTILHNNYANWHSLQLQRTITRILAKAILMHVKKMLNVYATYRLSALWTLNLILYYIAVAATLRNVNSLLRLCDLLNSWVDQFLLPAWVKLCTGWTLKPYIIVSDQTTNRTANTKRAKNLDS